MGDIQGSSVRGVNYPRRKLPSCNYLGEILLGANCPGGEAIALGGNCLGSNLLGGNCLGASVQGELSCSLAQILLPLQPYRE